VLIFADAPEVADLPERRCSSCGRRANVREPRGKSRPAPRGNARQGQPSPAVAGQGF